MVFYISRQRHFYVYFCFWIWCTIFNFLIVENIILNICASLSLYHLVKVLFKLFFFLVFFALNLGLDAFTTRFILFSLLLFFLYKDIKKTNWFWLLLSIGYLIFVYLLFRYTKKLLNFSLLCKFEELNENRKSMPYLLTKRKLKILYYILKQKWKITKCMKSSAKNNKIYIGQANKWLT